MGTSTYTPIASITLASTDSEIVFSSIPATYRDLILVVNGTSAATNQTRLQFNADGGSNYSTVWMYGDSSGTQSSSATTTNILLGDLTTSQSTVTAQILDYSATDKHKTVLSRDASGSAMAWASAGRWANSANAISSVTVYTASTFQIGTTFSLYGIAS